MKEKLIKLITDALNTLGISEDNISLEIPKNKDNGDYSTNIALKNAKKIKEFYEKSNIDIYVREKYINNANFVSVLSEYDKLIDVASLNSFVDLQKIVISNYKEMILSGEDSN